MCEREWVCVRKRDLAEGKRGHTHTHQHTPHRGQKGEREREWRTAIERSRSEIQMFYSISKNKYLFWLVTVAYTKSKAIHDATGGGGVVVVAAATVAVAVSAAAAAAYVTLNFNCEYNTCHDTTTIVIYWSQRIFISSIQSLLLLLLLFLANKYTRGGNRTSAAGEWTGEREREE